MFTSLLILRQCVQKRRIKSVQTKTRESTDCISRYPRFNYELQQYATGAGITMTAGTRPAFQ